MKIFKQSGPIAQIVVFLAFLVVCCLCAMGSLIAVVSLTGVVTLPAKLETATLTSTVEPSQTFTPLPEVVVSLSPLPGQWTKTPTLPPGQLTNTPTRMPIKRTVAPTVELVLPSSTPGGEPVTEATLTPETDADLRQIQIKYLAFQVAYKSVTDFHQQLDAEPALAKNENWKTQMITALSRLESAAYQLAVVKLHNPNYAVYAAYLDQLYAETGFMASAYRKGLDRHDPVSMQIATIHLQTMNEILIKADREFKAVKSRLATPAFSPEPSRTPDP